MHAVLKSLSKQLETKSLKELSVHLDAKDPLAKFKSEFYLPKGLYFGGMSLGPCSQSAEHQVMDHFKKWKRDAVKGHFGENGFSFSDQKLKPIMSSIVGCHPDRMVMSNGLSVNLHLLLIALYTKGDVLMCKDEFPSDQYAMQSHIKGNIVYAKDVTVTTIEKALDDNPNISMLFMSPVQYYTGNVMDIPKIVELCKSRNVFTFLDLAHSVGNIPLKLEEWDVDCAAWCTYKYLSGGPGSTAGAYVNKKHNLDKALRGWWSESHEQRFKMSPKFHGFKTVDRLGLSNPCTISNSSLFGSLSIYDKATLPEIFKKSKLLTGFLYTCLKKHNIKVITDIEHCGSQLSIKVGNNASEVAKFLENKHCIVDARHDVIRAAPGALWNSFDEVYQLSELLNKSMNK